MQDVEPKPRVRRAKRERAESEVVVTVELSPVAWTPERDAARRRAMEALIARMGER
jgi:hypothetical protein